MPETFNPLVSVVIPTYNIEKYVEEAVNSILTQTYTNLEIVIVDDGSTDNTYSILKELAGKDARIKLFRNERNERIVKTLNYALSNASGALIARMDGDDISLPTRLEKQVNFLRDHPDIRLVGLNVIIIAEDGEEIRRARYPLTNHYIVQAAKFAPPIPHFWLTYRETYDAVGPYRIPGVEDYDFILRCISKGLPLANLDDYLYKHRLRMGNSATSSGLEQRMAVDLIMESNRKRNAGEDDSLSEEAIQQKLMLDPNSLAFRMFMISSSYHHKYLELKGKSKLKSLLFMSIAVLLSPRRQILSIKNRMIFKGIKEKEMKKI